jgi:hypothetical protein
MIAMSAAVNELLAGRYFWMTSVTTPRQGAQPRDDDSGEGRRHQRRHPGRVEAVRRGDEDAGQPGEGCADGPHAERDPAGVRARQRGQRLRVDRGPHLESDVGTTKDDGAGHENEREEAVGDDLVGADRGTEDVQRLVRQRRETGCRGDRLRAEHEVGDGRQRDREADGRDEFGQRRLVAYEPEENSVEDDSEQRCEDEKRHGAGGVRPPAVL